MLLNLSPREQATGLATPDLTVRYNGHSPEPPSQLNRCRREGRELEAPASSRLNTRA